MQVTNASEAITGVIIGKMETSTFSVSNSAALINTLSSSLYSNGKLAAIREPLCNAWDSHIASEITDTPINVTIIGDLLTIRDFGNGIKHEDMADIYCTYGNSTKRNDGNQTGGFGLGSKAPFAYTDSMEVISYNEGVASIYVINKSSNDSDGMPTISRVTSNPTTESGLQISFRIKNTGDKIIFKNYIEYLCLAGGIKVIFNDEQLPTLNFNNDTNFFISNKLPTNMQSRVCVRYGNVLYSLDLSHAALQKYRYILIDISYYNAFPSYTLVFKAEPNSLSITPSRETLSYDAHTVKTLKTLLCDFIEEYNNKFFNYMMDSVKNQFNGVTSDKLRYGILLNRSKTGLFSKYNVDKHITSIKELCDFYLDNDYPPQREYYVQDVISRLNYMYSASYPMDLNQVKNYIRTLTHTPPQYAHLNKWYLKHFVKPIVKQAISTKLINICNLHCVEEKRTTANFVMRYSNYITNRLILTPFKKIKPAQLEHAFTYLVKQVIIASTKKDAITYIKDISNYKGLIDIGTLVYITKPKKKNNAISFFESLGYMVTDTIKTPVVKKKVTVKNEPIKEYKALNNIHRIGEAPIYINNPKFYVPYCKKSKNVAIKGIRNNNTIMYRLIAQYPSMGCLSFSKSDEKKLLKQGVPNVFDFLLEEIYKQHLENNDIKNAFSLSLAYHPIFNTELQSYQFNSYYNSLADVAELINETPFLQNNLNIPKVHINGKINISYLNILNNHTEHITDTTKLEIINECLQKIPFNKNLLKIFNKLIAKESIIHYLHFTKIKQMANLLKNDVPKQEEFLKPLLKILK